MNLGYPLYSGDIITSSARRLPFVNHKGIVLKVKGDTLILHNDSDRGVCIDQMEEFLAYRYIKKVEPSILNQCSEKEILHRFQSIYQKKYSLLSYNCDHFICTMLHKKEESKQLQFWIGGLGLLALIIALRKRDQSEGIVFNTVVKSTKVRQESTKIKFT